MKAWHFVGETLRDGSPIPADGVPLIFDDEPVLCVKGLHASTDPFDALQYAPGDTLCYVDCQGEIERGVDKLVCTRRTIIRRMDAAEMLRYYARMQALSVIHLYPNDNDDVVFDYLMTGDETLRSAAWSATSSATSRAARSAACSATSSAAWSAARCAARIAARCAAESEERSAAESEEHSAAYSAARADFNALVMECFGL